MANAPNDLARLVRMLASELQLDAVGVCRTDAVPQAAGRLLRFLEAGRHGDMEWMERHAERRGDPRVLWPEARSVVVVGLSYAPEDDPLSLAAERSRGAVSVYARGRDYHDLLKARLKQMARRFADTTSADVKVFVDTAPLMEKPLAAAAGLGWQGKHTNLVSREHGSWLFLGAILTTAEISPDEAAQDSCGSCQRCLDACPTAAFPAPYLLDARRCIAYLTIEHKGHIPREFRSAIGNRVFGCDDCLAVCPWNKFATVTREPRLQGTPGADALPLGELLALDDAAFRRRFAGTPVKRTGRDRVVRNALIAAGNSGDATLLADVERLTADAAPVVRAMAAWSTRRLASAAQLDEIRARALAHEVDHVVRAEWLDEEVS
jgi:epoxyqueuosine reductase